MIPSRASTYGVNFFDVTSIDFNGVAAVLWHVDSPTQILTLTLGDYHEVASLDDAAFELDLSNLKVEDR